MSAHPERRRRIARSSAAWRTSKKDIGASGQAIVEYALIAVLVCVAIAAVVTATGPAIGNIFSNTVYNLLGQKFTPEPVLSRDQILTLGANIAQYTLPAPTYQTNTPLSPTCASGPRAGTWAPTSLPPAPEGTWVPCP